LKKLSLSFAPILRNCESESFWTWELHCCLALGNRVRPAEKLQFAGTGTLVTDKVSHYILTAKHVWTRFSTKQSKEPNQLE